MSKLVSIVLALTAAFAVVSTSTPLFAAAPTVEYRTATVSYSGLNLATASGANALRSRVSGAVSELCGAELGRASVEHKFVHRCRATAFESARPQVERVLAGHRPQVLIASR